MGGIGGMSTACGTLATLGMQLSRCYSSSFSVGFPSSKEVPLQDRKPPYAWVPSSRLFTSLKLRSLLARGGERREVEVQGAALRAGGSGRRTWVLATE